MRRTAPEVLAIIGPGLIAANAGNDAPGIATYPAGAAWLPPLWAMPHRVRCCHRQEMAARMGAVTGKGLTDLIRENFGVR